MPTSTPCNDFERAVLASLLGLVSNGQASAAKYGGTPVPYQSAHKYYPDFECVTPEGKTILIESKGRFLPSDRNKHLLIRAQHPELDIRLLFKRDNTLSSRSKTTYTQWCEKHGIRCAVSNSGRVPVELLQG